MASKRGQRRRECGRKHKYPDAETAIKAKNRLVNRHPGEAYDAYLCPTCSAWHVGHRTQKNRQRIAQKRRDRDR